MKSLFIKSIAILTCIILASACHQNTKQSIRKVTLNKYPNKFYYNINDTFPGIIIDTLYINGSIQVKKTKCPINPPNITPLPFGPNVNINKLHSAYKYYSSLIYSNVGYLINEGWTPKALSKIKIYKLPLIKKINYLKISSTDTDRCENGKPFSNFFKINKYRYKLPDIGVYQCYYWCDYNPLTQEYSQTVKENCDWCIINFLYGYLVI